MSWRIVLSVLALAFLAWVGFEIGRAGNDVQYARSAGPDTLINGSVQGKRIDRRAWSLDYDKLTMSPDGTCSRSRTCATAASTAPASPTS